MKHLFILPLLTSTTKAQNCNAAVTRLKEGPADYLTISTGSADYADPSFNYQNSLYWNDYVGTTNYLTVTQKETLDANFAKTFYTEGRMMWAKLDEIYGSVYSSNPN